MPTIYHIRFNFSILDFCPPSVFLLWVILQGFGILSPVQPAAEDKSKSKTNFVPRSPSLFG